MRRVTIHNFAIPDRILRGSALGRETDAFAEEIANNARAAAPMVEGEPGDVPLPVVVDEYDPEQGRSQVWLAHPAGAASQAKHGTLTRAASAAGKRVK